jgi:signal transduction histidine kinase
MASMADVVMSASVGLPIAGRKDGLGLGLALSRQTMLDHGGDLWLASGPGESATFRLRLPLTLNAGNP